MRIGFGSNDPKIGIRLGSDNSERQFFGIYLNAFFFNKTKFRWNFFAKSLALWFWSDCSELNRSDLHLYFILSYILLIYSIKGGPLSYAPFLMAHYLKTIRYRVEVSRYSCRGDAKFYFLNGGLCSILSGCTRKIWPNFLNKFFNVKVNLAICCKHVYMIEQHSLYNNIKIEWKYLKRFRSYKGKFKGEICP